jgi:hypothetical protein
MLEQDERFRHIGFDVVVVEDATATFERKGPDGIRYSSEV